MRKLSEPSPEELRDRLIGLGERSFRKSYYPELQERLGQLERFRTLLDRASDAILLVELDSRRIVDANASACRQLGYPAGELVGREIGSVLAPGDLPGPEAAVEEVDCRTVTTTLRRRDGATIPVELLLCPDRFEDASYLVAVARDVTDRLRAEEELRRSEWEKALILESTEELVVFHDTDMRIIWANRAAERSRSQEQLVGRRCWEIWHRRSIPCQRCPVLRALRTGEPQQEEITAPDGRVWFVRGYPARHVAGEIEGVVELCLDITERKRAEEALRESDRMKSEFISTAAHELRTPLTTILGFTQVLLTQADLPPEERQEFLTYVRRQAEALSGLVDDLLDLSRIESGQGLALAPTACTAAEVAALANPFMQSSPAPGRFELALADAQTPVRADRKKLVQVFENLLSNAVKYSPKGSPIRIAGGKRDGSYLFSVSDRGIGMTPEQVAKVFDKFYRADASNTAAGGIGLGMSVVRNIIEAHGGRIWVESAPGGGTSVHFTLPLAEPEDAERKDEP